MSRPEERDPPFRSRDGGRFEVLLTEPERDLLASLPDQLRGVLSDPGDAALARLFPAAVPDDLLADAEFTMRTQAGLTDGRLDDLDTLERTVRAAELGEDDPLAWVRSLNDARLVLGVRLEVDDDAGPVRVARDDPRAPLVELFWFLDWIIESAVGELAA